MALQDEMNRLVIGIEREIESVEGDIAEGLCQRFADDWNLYEENGEYPEWLRWIVTAMLQKKGITEL
jgi:hypothetical protein